MFLLLVREVQTFSSAAVGGVLISSLSVFSFWFPGESSSGRAGCSVRRVRAERLRLLPSLPKVLNSTRCFRALRALASAAFSGGPGLCGAPAPPLVFCSVRRVQTESLPSLPNVRCVRALRALASAPPDEESRLSSAPSRRRLSSAIPSEPALVMSSLASHAPPCTVIACSSTFQTWLPSPAWLVSAAPSAAERAGPTRPEEGLAPFKRLSHESDLGKILRLRVWPPMTFGSGSSEGIV